eukprot:jgi/Ulvmu1/6609/UM003_0246.1
MSLWLRHSIEVAAATAGGAASAAHVSYGDQRKGPAAGHVSCVSPTCRPRLGWQPYASGRVEEVAADDCVVARAVAAWPVWVRPAADEYCDSVWSGHGGVLAGSGCAAWQH